MIPVSYHIYGSLTIVIMLGVVTFLQLINYLKSSHLHRGKK